MSQCSALGTCEILGDVKSIKCVNLGKEVVPRAKEIKG
jgi:hypothetical protein